MSGGMKSPKRFLVIGCGSIGKRHLGNLLALKADVMAFDIQEAPRREVKRKFDIEVVDRLEEAWERNPQVALIAVPTSLHVALALQAAKHGCHLFIEKPLSDKLEGVDQLLNSVRKRALTTLVGCNMRFHPGLVKVKRILEEGGVGRVVAARVEVGQYLPDWHPREDYRMGYSARLELGGGVILDAIHEIDYIRWMLGEVESVACFAGKLSHIDIETEDTAAILLRFLDGAIGEVHMDYVQRAHSRTCHIIGDEGTILWDYNTGEVRWYSVAKQEWQTFPNPPGWETNQMYIDEMKHFIKCIAGDEKPLLDVFDATRVLEIALAAKESARKGSVIKLIGR